MARTIIFDFDGTLCDNFDHSMAILNELSARYRFRGVDTSNRESLRDHTAREFIASRKIRFYRLPAILRAARREQLRTIDRLAPFPEIAESLRALRAQGTEIGILTSNASENVERFFRRHGLGGFAFVHSGSSLFGKARQLRRLMRRRKLKPEDLVYVGDETRDIEAARRAGVRVAAVSWGYNSRRALEPFRPDYLLDSPCELVDLARA